MTSGSKLYILAPVDGSLARMFGPFTTLPQAKAERDKIRKKWSKLGWETVSSMPSLILVKVVENVYIGEGEK